MKGNSQRESKGAPGIPSQPQKRRLKHSCAECGSVDCPSFHESAVLECPLKDCYVCADLTRIDDKISTAYKYLSDLVQERQKIAAKLCHDPVINRLPVEILSSIFVSVKDAIIDLDFEEWSDVVLPQPEYQQPSQSPPLLVGAVCKRWREITLTTPRLWTDIIVDLKKSADGQIDMVTNWASRAGAIPLDITVFIGGEHDYAFEQEVSEEVGDVLRAIRKVAVRWNDIALRLPASFSFELLNDLPENPAIGTLFLEDPLGSDDNIKLQHPLRPRHLISDCNYGGDIRFDWDRLVFVNISSLDTDNILHIIRHAHNLRYCIAIPEDSFAPIDLGPPEYTGPITNLSLIHLNVTWNIIGHLTLPSLSCLDYQLHSRNLSESLDTVVEFIERSSPSLDQFIIRLFVLSEEGRGPFPSFEKLPGITSLFIELVDAGHRADSWMENFFQALTRPSLLPIFPHLKQLTGPRFNMSASSWKSFTHLFLEGSNPAEGAGEPAIRRPLSEVQISVYDPVLPVLTLDKETFLRLLEVKKSGVDLAINILGRGDFFEFMAQIYGVKL